MSPIGGGVYERQLQSEHPVLIFLFIFVLYAFIAIIYLYTIVGIFFILGEINLVRYFQFFCIVIIKISVAKDIIILTAYYQFVIVTFEMEIRCPGSIVFRLSFFRIFLINYHATQAQIFNHIGCAVFGGRLFFYADFSTTFQQIWEQNRFQLVEWAKGGFQGFANYSSG